MFKKLSLILVLLIAFCSFAFAGSTIIYGTGPQSVTTGGDVELAKIIFSFIDDVGNCTVTAHASSNTWTSNAVWAAGLTTTGGQYVMYDFKSDYGSLTDRNMYGQWKAYRTSEVKHDLAALFADGIWIDTGTCTVCATFIYDFVQTKQSDINYDDNK